MMNMVSWAEGKSIEVGTKMLGDFTLTHNLGKESSLKGPIISPSTSKDDNELGGFWMSIPITSPSQLFKYISYIYMIMPWFLLLIRKILKDFNYI